MMAARLRACGLASIAFAAIAIANTANAVDYLWNATGVNALIDTGGNWVGGTAPDLSSTTVDTATFAASTNTTVTIRDLTDPLTAGDYFASMTFDASAPAYTFANPAGNTVNGIRIQSLGSLTNNSANAQTFNTTEVSLLGGTTAGSDAFLNATSGNAGTHSAFNIGGNLAITGGGTSGTFINANSYGAKITGDFDTHVAGALAGDGTMQKTGAGTLFLNSASTATTTIYIGFPNGTLTGDVGAVRISNNDALGAVGNITRIYGNANSNGRLELTNNITVGETIQIYGRQAGTLLSPAILNVSGDNTLNGTITIQSGGGDYNFGSTSGKLAIASNINWSNSGERRINWYGNGDGEFAGNLTGSSVNVAHGLFKNGSGTLTLSGAANDHVGPMLVLGGTLRIAATAGLAFAATPETFALPHIHVQSGATLNVADVAGGFSLIDTMTLSGGGGVTGSIVANDGSKLEPGATYDIANYVYTDIAGKLTISGDLNMSAAGAGANMVWQLGALSTANPGTDFDQISVGGNLALGGSSTLTLDFSLESLGGADPNSGDPFWSANHSWKIVETAGNSGNTNFTTLVGAGPFGNGGAFATSVGAVASIAGDANNDGVVNIFDINFVSSNWNTTGPNGDVNHDNLVNIFDINLISSNWNHTGPVGNLGDIFLNYTVAGGTTAVPEPTSGLLLVLGGLALVIGARRYRQRA